MPTIEKAIELVKDAFNSWESEYCCAGEDWTEEHEARDLAIDALEKQVPMIVTDIHVDEYFCPNCGSENAKDYGSKIGDCYCPVCGQKIAWGERKEE